MSAEDFIRLFAIAQAAPGPNILFASVVGWKVAGPVGAVVALVSICGPAAVIAWCVSTLWEKYREAPWRIALQRAIAPLVVGLILSGGYVLATPSTVPDWRLWLIASATAAAMLATKVNPLWFLAAGGAAGAILLS
jgi:chromate transporter